MSKISSVEEYEYMAKHYDTLMHDLDYSDKANKIAKVFNKFSIKSVVDLGCGTGSLIVNLKKYGFECVGIDKSKSMIAEAYRKDSSINWIVGDMVTFNFNNKFDAAICLFDTVNHILDTKNLSLFLRNVHAILKNNGIFLFDMNTKNKGPVIDKKSITKEIDKNVKLVWSNKVKGKFWVAKLAFVEGNEEFIEVHKERLYSIKDMQKYLKKHNFKIIKIYDNLAFEKEVDESKSTRALFLVQKAQLIISINQE